MSSATVTVLPSAPLARMREVFERQRTAALRLRCSTATERLSKLKRLRDAVLSNTEAWYQASAKDMGKPRGEVDLSELLPVAVEFNDAISHLSQWMKPTPVPATLVTAGTSSHVRYEPKGRCLIISPWNYPLNLTLCPLISAIAAGNTVILKPSELTPNMSAAMAKLIREVFSEDEVALFEGDASVSQGLLELPFDHIFFTGSPAIGKVVMAAAAKHLASVTLELGGKSPTIVDSTADLSLAARNVMWAKCTNAGQTCIAPDHVFVHSSVKDSFIAKCREQLEKAYGGQVGGPNYTRIVNSRHTQRVKGLLDDATARGAKVLAGGKVDEAGNVIAPTLLEGIPDDAKIMQEEIFGPLLPVISFQSLDEVIARINREPKPLALYIFSEDDSNVRNILEQTSSGGAAVNHSLMQFVQSHLPFGGVNNSGIGNSHGLFGFKAFSHERAVLQGHLKVGKLFGAGELPAVVRTALSKIWKLV